MFPSAEPRKVNLHVWNGQLLLLLLLFLLLLLLHSRVTEKEEDVTLPPFWLDKFLYIFSLYYATYQCNPFSDL